MGGAVSSGESNDDLIDNLLEADYIKSPLVERVFRAVDRALYYTQSYKMNAYKDLAWKDGNLHLSAPCIYSEVMENLKLEPGMSFLNMGSGTGYLSTMCGLIIGQGGVNHGIELYSEVAEYARDKLEEFFKISPAIDMFDFCPPDFVVGNCLDPISSQQRYDRIYCGAACPEECIRNITDLLKIGGICVCPVNDSLIQITRVSDDKEERKSLLPVSFATLITPRNGVEKKSVILPEWKLPTLKELCRSEIRLILRKTIMPPDTRNSTEDGRKKRRRRRQDRRRASRLLVVQRRRSGAEDGETGFVAVAYSLGNNTSDDDDDDDSRDSRRNRQSSQEDDDNETNSPMHSDNDEEMRCQYHETSDSSDEDVELPELEPIPSAVVNSSDNGTQYNPSQNGHPSTTKDDGKKHSDTQNGEPTCATGSSSSAAPTRSRGILGRARNTRIGGSDGIFGRLREIYRRRDQGRSGDLLRQVEQNLQQISSRTAQIRQMVSGSSANSGTLHAPATSALGSSSGGGNREAPMDEEEEENNSTLAGNSSTNFNSNVRNVRRKNDDSCVWSTDSSLDNSSTTSMSSTSDEDEKHLRTAENHRASGSTESGVATDTDKKDSSEIKAEKESEDPTLLKLKSNPFSVQMRNKIEELMLPPSVKFYLNYNRPFGEI